MKAKQKRSSILWARISPKNAKWINSEMKRLNYRSVSEYTDDLLSSLNKTKAKISHARKKK